MKAKSIKSAPQIIFQGNKPVSVIVEIDQYREMLERLEDAEDLKMLNELKKKPLKFRKFDDFLKEYNHNV